MNDYIKKITEVFNELAVIAESISDEDKVVYLLAGLPESYSVLVTALESGLDIVPALEMVIERFAQRRAQTERQGRSRRQQEASCGQRKETTYVSLL